MYTRPCSTVTVTATATGTVNVALLSLLPIYDHLIEIEFRRVVAISCKWIYAYIRLLWSRLQPGDTLTRGHVCACLCCFNSYTFGIVMPLLICVRYRYSILVDIWLISTPGVLRLLAGIDNEYKVYFNVFPYGWMDDKWAMIGVTLLMQMCWKYNNAAIWMNIGMKVIIVTLWLYIGQYDGATRDVLARDVTYGVTTC